MIVELSLIEEEAGRRAALLVELFERPEIADVYLDERSRWLLGMWADGALTREELASALDHHAGPLLAGLPGGAAALDLLRDFDRVA